MATARYLLVAALVALCASHAAAQGGLLDSLQGAAGAAVGAVTDAVGTVTDAVGGVLDQASGVLGMDDEEAPADSVVGVARASNSTTILLAALEAAGLDQGALEDPDFNATVFAPTDEAFAAALAGLGLTADQLLADVPLLETVLQYHVVPGTAAMAADLADGAQLATLLEGPEGQLQVDLEDPASPALITSSGQVVSIIATDIPAGAAVVHLVADVLLPANLTAPVMMEGDAGALPAVDLAGEAGIMPEMEGDAADAPAAAN